MFRNTFQDESRSISENCTGGIRRRFEQGKVTVNHTKFMGYDKDEEGVLNWSGKAKWYESSIRKMLSNEKYKGDALLQKTYTVNFLTKKR